MELQHHVSACVSSDTTTTAGLLIEDATIYIYISTYIHTQLTYERQLWYSYRWLWCESGGDFSVLTETLSFYTRRDVSKYDDHDSS